MPQQNYSPYYRVYNSIIAVTGSMRYCDDPHKDDLTNRVFASIEDVRKREQGLNLISIPNYYGANC